MTVANLKTLQLFVSERDGTVRKLVLSEDTHNLLVSFVAHVMQDGLTCSSTDYSLRSQRTIKVMPGVALHLVAPAVETFLSENRQELGPRNGMALSFRRPGTNEGETDIIFVYQTKTAIVVSL